MPTRFHVGVLFNREGFSKHFSRLQAAYAAPPQTPLCLIFSSPAAEPPVPPQPSRFKSKINRRFRLPAASTHTHKRCEPSHDCPAIVLRLRLTVLFFCSGSVAGGGGQNGVTPSARRPMADSDPTRLSSEQHVSVQTRLSLSRTGREDVPGPRLAVGRGWGGLCFRLPLSLSAAASRPAPPPPPSGTRRLPELPPEWPETSLESNACTLAEEVDKTPRKTWRGTDGGIGRDGFTF